MHKVVEFFIEKQNILSCIFMFLLTFGSEHILSATVFKCPCNSWNMVYGYCFLLAPAFLLLVLSFMANAWTWRLWVGKCCSKKGDQCCPGGICASFCQALLPMTASVAPLTWIAVALLEANFYECAASGSSVAQSYFCEDNITDCRNLLLKVPCDEELSGNFSSKRLSLHAQSQLIGWLLIVCIMIVALISKCVRRCSSSINYLHLKFLKNYTKKEDKLFEEKSKQCATQLAERNISYFFEATDPAAFHIPSNDNWQKISPRYEFDSDVNYYSRLHKYLKDRGVTSPNINEENQNCTDFGNGNEAETNV